jgi:hypothetical protein
MEMSLQFRFQGLLDYRLRDSIRDRWDGTRKLHRITASLWDGLKSPILSIPFEVRAFKS